MDRQQPAHGDEGDFFESVRRAAERSPGESSPTERIDHADVGHRAIEAEPGIPPVTADTADALRSLGERIADLEQQVRQLNEDRARVVADIAEAVVARLDARWARTLGDDAPGHVAD